MGLLAKKGGGDEEKDPSGQSLDLERKHCPGRGSASCPRGARSAPTTGRDWCG